MNEREKFYNITKWDEKADEVEDKKKKNKKKTVSELKRYLNVISITQKFSPLSAATQKQKKKTTCPVMYVIREYRYLTYSMYLP